jgi:hypothetical protein
MLTINKILSEFFISFNSTEFIQFKKGSFQLLIARIFNSAAHEYKTALTITQF